MKGISTATTGMTKKHKSIEERGKPVGRVPLPEGRARAVKCLRRRRKGQIIGLLGGELSETIEGSRSRVDFAHGFQEQILQGGVKILAYKHSVARGEQVNVRTRNVAAQADEAPP